MRSVHFVKSSGKISPQLNTSPITYTFPKGQIKNHKTICGWVKGYKGSKNEEGIEDVVLVGEQGNSHVTEDEVLSHKIHKFKKLQNKMFNFGYIQEKTTQEHKKKSEIFNCSLKPALLFQYLPQALD